jgi:hypothetical protein
VDYARAGAPYNVIINPTNDGYVDDDGKVKTDWYLMVESSVGRQGIVKFSTSPITEPVLQASLSVNPYGLPFQSLLVEVYGYQSSDAQITSSDRNAGAFLGNLVIPETIDYGQDILIDVTQFMKTVSSPFVSFNLRTTGGLDIFSSLEYNAGHPSQLTVTIPEPATLLLLGLGSLLLRKRK